MLDFWQLLWRKAAEANAAGWLTRGAPYGPYHVSWLSLCKQAKVGRFDFGESSQRYVGAARFSGATGRDPARHARVPKESLAMHDLILYIASSSLDSKRSLKPS